jgi:hypothetical protein
MKYNHPAGIIVSSGTPYAITNGGEDNICIAAG